MKKINIVYQGEPENHKEKYMRSLVCKLLLSTFSVHELGPYTKGDLRPSAAVLKAV